MVTLTLTDEQATLLQRALEDAVDLCSDHYDQLCADGATDCELESARRNHRQAADVANALERARLRAKPPAMPEADEAARRDVACQGKIVGWVRRQGHNGKWMGRCTTAQINRFNCATEGDAVRFVQNAHYGMETRQHLGAA